MGTLLQGILRDIEEEIVKARASLEQKLVGCAHSWSQILTGDDCRPVLRWDGYECFCTFDLGYEELTQAGVSVTLTVKGQVQVQSNGKMALWAPDQRCVPSSFHKALVESLWAPNPGNYKYLHITIDSGEGSSWTRTSPRDTRDPRHWP